MRLERMIAGGGVDYRIAAGDPLREISRICYDSRRVLSGDLFFSLARDEEQRRAHLDDALSRGARAVVVRRGDEDVAARPAMTVVTSERPRPLMGVAASRLFGAPSEQLDLVGITGTSGKTTTSYLLASIFAAAGAPAGIVGTLGIFIGGKKLQSALTTPESVDFEAALAEMVREKVARAAAEISSIGIAEGRADRLSFRACLFTNFSRDHLDYHGTLENYFAAKLRLFTEILPRSRRGEPVAIARGDTADGRRVLDAFKGRRLSFGLSRTGADIYPLGYEIGLKGIRARLKRGERELEICSPLIGEFNLLNILGACAVSEALGIGDAAVVEGVRRCPGAPGRMEAVKARPGVMVLVDYAHKPDALESVLKALGALKPARILCVFGCGGDRDRGKRPLMGAIAGRLAQLAILTSDNPRTEDPLKIIAETEAGLSGLGLARLSATDAAAGHRGYAVEPDRRAAIALALKLAAAGDVVLIAGKGHEDYQIVGTRKLRFDDREVVRELAAEMTGAVA